jgi:hypothetical protein
MMSKGRPRKFEPETRKARDTERQRRAAQAQAAAHQHLISLYPDMYARLYQQHLARINDERGPLPGDDE